MPDEPIPAPPAPVTADVATPPPRAGWLRGLGAVRWIGVALVAASLGLAIAAQRRADLAWLEFAALVVAGGGAALAASARRALGWLPWVVAAGALAALAFAQAWSWGAWPALGCCLGAALRWGYARKRRAWWFTGALVALAYLVCASAGLMRAGQGRGIVWIAAQGLGSLAIGLALHRLAPRLAGSPAVAAVAAVAARALTVAGIVLPYAALAAMALARAA